MQGTIVRKQEVLRGTEKIESGIKRKICSDRNTEQVVEVQVEETLISKTRTMLARYQLQ